MKVNKNIYGTMISVENLFLAWHKFKLGKMKKKDVQEFNLHLEKHIFKLHRDLISGNYKHGKYYGFYIQDPKLRHIHKAEVRDRIVHQIAYTTLTQIFEPMFIHHSYSCRIEKGTHKAVKALEVMIRKIAHNYTSKCYVLKCDIKKFFDSVGHEILLEIICRKIKDERACNLFREIIESFTGYKDYLHENVGIPIGNITSQIFANIYLNELDQYVKHYLKEKHYIRYADDFLFISSSKNHLNGLIPKIEVFLNKHLRMQLHPDKVFLLNTYQGVDFLGYVLFPKYKILRTKTKQRMFRRMKSSYADFANEKTTFEDMNQLFQSYFGIMGHGNCYKLFENIKKEYWIYLI